MSTDVVELIGNPRPGSRTRTLADTVTKLLVARLATHGITLSGVTILELADVVGVSFSADAPARGSVGIRDPFGAVRSARLLVVATPTYKGSFTGLLKIFFDQYRPDDLTGTVAVGVAVAASDDHLRQVAPALDALLVAVDAEVPAVSVALLELQLADAEHIVAEWVDKHVEAIAEALRRSGPRA